MLGTGPDRRVGGCAGGRQVVDHRGRDQRHQPGGSRVAAPVLLAPANDTVRGCEPVGAAAGEDDGSRLLWVGERVDHVRLPSAGPATADVDTGPGPGGRQDDGAAGRCVIRGPMADLEALGQRWWL